MSAPLNLQHWVDRLRAEVPALKTVGLAGDMRKVKDLVRAVPAAWVYPGPERVTATDRSPQSYYRMSTEVHVLIAMRHYGDTVGGQAVDALREVRLQIEAALIRWQPPDALVPAVPRGGAPLPIEANAMWWLDRFETSRWS